MITDFSAWRFLIAEDKQFIRLMVQGLLERQNARQILTASCGADALKILRREGSRISCIISDWNMNPVTGLELLQAVRAGEVPDLQTDVCFILLTGHSQATVVQAAVRLDVNAYLVKPISQAKLLQTVPLAMSKKITVKSPETYRAVTELHVPSGLAEATAKTPPWVLWAVKSPKKSQFIEEMSALRREILASAMDTGAAVEVKNVKRKALMEINAGMVMAEDVYDVDGRLLVGNGTVLSARILDRLTNLISVSGQSVQFRVGERIG